MITSEKIDQLAPAIHAAQADATAVAKSGNNTFDKYKYAKHEDFVHVVRPLLAKHGLSLLASPCEVVGLEERKTKSGGTEHAVRVKVTSRLIHTSGQWIQTDAWGEGQDRGDKGLYKAITGARKYALACLFGLATSDDPENDNGNGEPPPANRATPQNNGEHSGPRDRFIKAAAAWTRIGGRDLTNACAEIGRANGVSLSKTTASADFDKLTAFCVDQAGRSIDFLKWSSDAKAKAWA